jgi:hypothetical protein
LPLASNSLVHTFDQLVASAASFSPRRREKECPVFALRAGALEENPSVSAVSARQCQPGDGAAGAKTGGSTSFPTRCACRLRQNRSLASLETAVFVDSAKLPF